MSCHCIVGFFQLSVHVRPLCTYMPHDFIRWPLRMLLLKLFSVLLAEVNVSRERFLRSCDFSLGSHVRTDRFIVVCRWCILCMMRINLSTFQRSSLNNWTILKWFMFLWPFPFLQNALIFKWVVEILRKRLFVQGWHPVWYEIVFFNLLLNVLFLTALSSEFINLLDESLMFSFKSFQILVRLLFEILELFFCNILPNSSNFLHDVQRRYVRMIPHNLGSRLL